MEKRLDSNLHELVVHGTKDMPIAFYNDSYDTFLNRFFYMHYHEEYEFVYSLKGEMDLLINGKSFHIKNQEGILINSNMLHLVCHSNYPETDLMFIVFSSHILEFAPILKIQKNCLNSVFSMDYEAIIFTRDIPWKNRFLDEMTKAFIDHHKKAFGYEIDITIHLLAALKELYVNKNEIPSMPSIDRNDVRIKKALSYIKEHYSEQISLEDLANTLYLSNEQCSRIFKRYTGFSPIEYLISYRIQISCNYLLSTKLSITEIAMHCGFSSSNYYTITFKKHMKMTPKEYREKMAQ